MEQELWLSRDDTSGGHYNVSTGDPTFSPQWGCEEYIVALEPEDFHKLFPGQSLRKGRKKKIKRILIELVD